MTSNDLDKTMMFDIDELKEGKIKSILNHVNDALTEKGYNSINQIVGYLISNDTAYISSYKDSRKLLQSLTRDEIIEELVKSYLNKNEK
jgi:uncharacterized protein (UPF0297 family)